MDDKEYNTSDYFDENKRKYPHKANLYPYEARLPTKYSQSNPYYETTPYTNDSFCETNFFNYRDNYPSEQFTSETDFNFHSSYYSGYKDIYQPSYYSVPEIQAGYDNQKEFRYEATPFYNDMTYEYFSEQSKYQRKRRSAKRKNRENTKCAHCGTAETPLWRHLDVLDVCNACWLYFKAHGSQRPYDPNKKSIIRRMRSKRK